METATYCSKFIAARACVEQVLDLFDILCYLGVLIHDKSFMFGVNKSDIDSSMFPHAKLHKRWHALSFHCIREAVAAKIIGFYHITGNTNAADLLSKHCGYSQVWHILQLLLFWQGDTALLLDECKKLSLS